MKNPLSNLIACDTTIVADLRAKSLAGKGEFALVARAILPTRTERAGIAAA
jgi:hypothetical protein